MSRSSVVAFLMLPEYTAINGTFCLARRLAERGLSIRYLGPPRLADHIRRQGFDFDVVQLWWETDVEAMSAAQGDLQRVARWRRRRVRNHKIAQYHEPAMDRLGRWLDERQPAMVILDPLVWNVAGPILSRGIPIIGLSATLASVWDVRKPPVFSGIVPARRGTMIDRARCAVAWLGPLWKTAKCEMTHRVRQLNPWDRAYRRWHPMAVVKEYARLRCSEYGPRLVMQELVCAPHAVEFPGVAERSQRVYLGPCVDGARQDGVFDWKGIDRTKPILYCSVGTYGRAYKHARRLFEAVVAAVAGQSEWQAVVQVGDVANCDEVGSLPPNVVVSRWVPQVEVLRHASAFMTQGGLGSIREAAYWGVPLIVFPCWYDQPGNAARVVFHGLGIRADMARIDQHQILPLLAQVRQERYRCAAKRMQGVIRAETGIEVAAAMIQQRVERARADAPHPGGAL